MSIAGKIRREVEEWKLTSHNADAVVTADKIRLMELLERQATIIEILGEINPEYLKRLSVEDWRP